MARHGGRFVPPSVPRRAALVLPLAAQAPDPVAAVMARLAAVREVRASFVEDKDLPELDRPLTSRGLLSWRAPDRLEKRTLEPAPELFLVEGDTLTLERPERGIRETLSLDTAPEIRPLVEALRATLAGDLATLRRYHEVTFSGTPQRWRLLLVPLSVRARAAVQRIVLEGEEGFMSTVETQGSDGRSRLVATRLP
ncbi:outer membrane lipoprotein carrier protein LolA [Roseomonas sp. JC162]|uniref:Outer membrane lipoprotein carrier protein LolA n=1 Tax=Neoroseomonas marina TaxID=1232220 RepID=A0A848EBA3_9PROT|nr:LolA-related protein [Neoroseomonas marina]NMJ41306.1 outer membrane lipoprotein carrier protein LolA [Neoroseomonas marina]